MGNSVKLLLLLLLSLFIVSCTLPSSHLNGLDTSSLNLNNLDCQLSKSIDLDDLNCKLSASLTPNDFDCQLSTLLNSENFNCKLSRPLTLDDFECELSTSLTLDDFDCSLPRSLFDNLGTKSTSLLTLSDLEWHPWRVSFEVDENRVSTLPRPRQGFHYGHGGHGRDAIFATHIGDKSWKDYVVSLDFMMLPVDPGFRPHYIPPGTARGFYLLFRAEDLKESWNEAGRSVYQLSFNENGGWGLTRYNNLSFSGSVGRGRNSPDCCYPLAKGRSSSIHLDRPNHLRLEVKGKRIRGWLNDELLVDYIDNDPNIGGRALDYGGIAFSWRYESMGWVENFTLEHLD